jgi:hypothetical protein
MIDWLLTDDGQTLVARAGYIPVRPLANDHPADALDPIYIGDTTTSSGTGGTVPKTDWSEIIDSTTQPPLSELFFDGFNYIEYINSVMPSFHGSNHIHSAIFFEHRLRKDV